MKSFKFLIVVVVLLITINCVLLTSLWFTKYNFTPPPPPTGAGGPPKQANEYLIKELAMTPQQVKQYEVLKTQHFDTTKILNEKNRTLHDAFFENIKTPVLNKKAVDVIAKLISDNTFKLDTVTLYHFRKLRAILTPSQQQKFDKIIQNALHMMGGRPGGGGPPPGQQPPQQGMRQPGGPGNFIPPPPKGSKGKHPPHGGPPPQGMGRPQGPPPDGMGPPPGYGPPDRDMMPPPGGPRPGMSPPGGGPLPGGGPPPGY